MLRVRRALIAVGLVVSALPPDLAGADPPLRVDSAGDHALARVLTRRVRFERRWPAAVGACASIDAADLRVRLRGVVIDGPNRVFLERERRPAVHALLVDTSESLEGNLEDLRGIATRYLEESDFDGDRAFVLAFDDEPWMAAPITGDRSALLRAVAQLRPGGMTVLHDALVVAAEELMRAGDGGILVVITDGVDSGSLADRDLVRQAVLREGGPAVFVVAFKVPPLMRGAPAGLNSTRKFLQGLARDSGGAYLEAVHHSSLFPIIERVRELILSEAEVQVVDPLPEAPPRKLQIESLRPGCRVRVLDGSSSRADAGSVADLDLAAAAAALPSDPFRGKVLRLQRAVVDPDCAAASRGSPPTSLVDDGHQLELCLWSETKDLGRLYDPYVEPAVPNSWPGAKVRPLTVPLPRLAELSGDPIDAIAAAAERAWERRDEFIERDPRHEPAWWHARPYHDHPLLVGSRTFFLLPAALARAMAMREDYREWLTGVVREECARALLRLVDRLARLAPESKPATIRRLVEESPEGQRLIARAKTPNVLDAERHLGVWLGDLSAHDALARWEERSATEMLNGAVAEAAANRFVERWLALRDLFWVPSYARALGVLVPVRDEAARRVGFWRVVLPRLALSEERRRGPDRHADPDDVPFDLLPDRPHGFEYLWETLSHDRGLAGLLRDGGWQVREIRHASREKPYRQDPLRAFGRSSVTVVIARGAETVRLEVEVDAPRSRRRSNARASRALAAAVPDGGLRAAELARRFATVP